MLATLISFFGGSFARMLFGEISAWMTSRQDHNHELERMRLQGELDEAQHTRTLDSLRLQAELGVKTIVAQAESAVGQIEADTWGRVAAGTLASTGIWLVDLWNGIVRPLVATWAIAMVTLNIAAEGWVLDDNGWNLCGAALGIYLADRALFKRGK